MVGDSTDPGFTFLAARDLLKSGKARVSCSYVQIYNSAITDLLAPGGGKEAVACGLRLRGDGGTGEVEVEGATLVQISTAMQVDELIRKGASRRKVASHLLNSESSRSHAIFTYHISALSGADEGGKGGKDCEDEVDVVSSKLHIVDLAGSERVKESGVSGSNLKEAIGINLSLFYLR